MKKCPWNGNINCKAKNRKGEILNKIMQELSKYKFVKKQTGSQGLQEHQKVF
jgi:hypothetical protein